VHVRLDRELNKSHSENLSENMAKWDEKKMSKVWSQVAKSKSIAANFDAKKWKSHLVTPLQNFAGKDLFKIQEDNLEKESEERKAVDAKIAAARATEIAAHPESATTSSTKDQVAVDESSPGKKADGDTAGDGKVEEGDSGAKVTDGSNAAEAGADGKSDAKEEKGPAHSGISCDGCKIDPIVGIRWKCMTCVNYDLCDSCHTVKVHDQHQMLKIEHPEDAISVEDSPLEDDTNSVLLGFRVYSRSHAPVQIAGQLSNGQVVPWKNTD